MGRETGISWCQHTFNPWIGCARISPACDGCYAAAMMQDRYHRAIWGGPGVGAGTRSRTSESNWKQPLAWNRAAEKAGTRPFVFCSSLADVFDNAVPPEWRADLFDLIQKTPQLVWLLLTKRPQNIESMVDDAGGIPPNVAFGATCEDQKRYDMNAKHLAFAKSVCRPLFTFISAEPLLGPIDLYALPAPNNALSVDWVITGGETDQGQHKARPTRRAWLRSLRDQCAAAGIAYHHKQNGEFLDVSELPFERLPRGTQLMAWVNGAWTEHGDAVGDAEWTARIGKHKSGRLLDGVIHDAFPELRP